MSESFTFTDPETGRTWTQFRCGKLEEGLVVAIEFAADEDKDEKALVITGDDEPDVMICPVELAESEIKSMSDRARAVKAGAL